MPRPAPAASRPRPPTAARVFAAIARRALGLAPLFAAALLAAPDIAPAQVGGEGPVVIGYDIHGRARAEAEQAPDDASAQVQVLSVSAGLPLMYPRARLMVMPVLSYMRLAPDRGGADAEQGIESLHATMITLVGHYAINDDWSVIGLLGGGFASDFKGVWLDDYVLSGSLIGSYRFSEDFSLGAGVGYDRRTGEVRPLPLVQLDWHFTPNLRLSGVVPARVYLGWRAHERFTVGLRGGLEGERFHVDADPFGVEDVEVAWSVVKLAPSVVLHLGGVIHLDLHGGLSTQRRFEVFVDDVAETDVGLETSWFFGARLWLGLSGWRRDQARSPQSPDAAPDR